MLSSLVAAGRQSNAAIARLCSRGVSASAFAANDALQTKDSAFLRFGNPVPSDVGMSQHLPALPETKVRGWSVSRAHSPGFAPEILPRALHPSSRARGVGWRVYGVYMASVWCHMGIWPGCLPRRGCGPVLCDDHDSPALKLPPTNGRKPTLTTRRCSFFLLPPSCRSHVSRTACAW